MDEEALIVESQVNGINKQSKLKPLGHNNQTRQYQCHQIRIRMNWMEVEQSTKKAYQCKIIFYNWSFENKGCQMSGL